MYCVDGLVGRPPELIYDVGKTRKGWSTIFCFFASIQRVIIFLTPSSQPKAYCINVDTWMYCIAEQTHEYFLILQNSCLVFVLSFRYLIILMLLKLIP